MSNIWVLTSADGGEVTGLSLELLTLGRSLGDVTTFFVGEGGGAIWGHLGTYGAQEIIHLQPDSILASAPIAAVMTDQVAEKQPDLILFGQSYDDRDVAGRLAARLGSPILTNASEVQLEPEFQTTHEIFGGSHLATATIEGDKPYLVCVRPKSVAAEPGEPHQPSVTTLDLPPSTGTAQIVSSHTEQRSGPQLEEAAIVISGGRGLGNAEAFSLIENLAQPLSAATGATRAIVDAGWVPYAKQVGQTGKTVKPDIYIACGISGAMQHQVGMKDAGTIIAINKDPDAPIFGLADLGVVGDVHQVLPKLIEEISKRT